MAERSDRAPLLDWEETPPPDPDPTGPPAAAAGPRWSSGGAGGTCSSRSDGGSPQRSAEEVRDRPEPPGPDWSDLPDVTVPGQWEEKDQVVAVFVVTFDTRSGNMVEWCRPHDIDLDGVEFKSMASGSHRVTADFIYFRKGSCFGLACFANMAVESELERGARMKSVGILSPSYTLLYRYMNFLENQVRLQLQSPGHYSPLEAFYKDKKAEFPPTGSGVLTSWSRCLQPEMKITHPAGCMSQFVQFFGDQIFVLWKFTLLRKRLLFLSPPPVGVVCYRVYCCCCLANVSLPGVGVSAPELRPFFYVNVTDIAALETETSYVACTTEKIFEEKKQLYDVYVDNQNVKTHKRHLQPLLKINQTDRDKYRRLTEQRQALLYSQELDSDTCSSSEEDLFILFFMELNNRIFQMLSEVAASSDPTLTVDHVRSMGLDPQGDRCFLLDLIDVYGFDVTLVVDDLCCS